MPQLKDAHIDKALTSVSTAVSNEGYVADQLVPIVDVKKQADKYFTFDNDSLRVDQETLRANGTLAREVNLNVSTGSYFAEEHALRNIVTKLDIENSDSPLNAKMDAAELVASRILIAKERAMNTFLTATGNYTTTNTLTGTDLWSDFTGSDPVDNVEVGKNTVLALTGREPNTCVMGNEVWLKLKQHPDIVDRVKYTMAATSSTITQSLVAQVLGVDRLIVPTGVYDTTAETETGSTSIIFGNFCALYYVPLVGGRKKKPSFAYQFRLKSHVGTRQYADEARRGIWVEHSDFYDLKSTSANSGYLFTAAVA